MIPNTIFLKYGWRSAFVVSALAIGMELMGMQTSRQVEAAEPTVRRDIEYATVEDQRLLLDLYLPAAQKDAARVPLVIWVHGGAWRAGSKKDMPLGFLLPRGYAIASVDYRLSPVAKFPAQVHDIKAAIRFLRASRHKYGFDSERVAIAGSSAGGHLAALVGVTNGHAALEGTVGDHADQSSSVQAIVDLYGPTNFHTILKQSTPHGLSVRVPAFELLLGGLPEQNRELASLASPVAHVDANDPPLLMLHGDQDPQVPINQSHELDGAYQTAGASSRLVVVHGGAHGGPQFFDDARQQRISEFLDRVVN